MTFELTPEEKEKVDLYDQKLFNGLRERLQDIRDVFRDSDLSPILRRTSELIVLADLLGRVLLSGIPYSHIERNAQVTELLEQGYQALSTMVNSTVQHVREDIQETSRNCNCETCKQRLSSTYLKEGLSEPSHQYADINIILTELGFVAPKLKH